MRKPSIGDIWYNHLGKFHYLILQDDFQMFQDPEKAYTMLILESGKIDHAWAHHFYIQCSFVQ